MPSNKKRDVAIVVAGQAGQGIQTIESVLTKVLKRSGYHVFATKEYMSRIRGGSNSTLTVSVPIRSGPTWIVSTCWFPSTPEPSNISPTGSLRTP